jgi:aldehyde:ferredoxin oxidoreductase
MGYGFTGKILRVDLTYQSTRVETFDEAFYRLYAGGKALAGYFLLRELTPHTEPLDPENLLVLATGLLTGAPFSTATRFTAAARSPLTRAYGESEAAGYWGPELKMAGYDAIVITGRAAQPVYLWIHDDKVEIRDARHVWGRDPLEVQETIRAAHGDKLIRVLQIGIGGENLVRFAALTNELRHFNGRNGIGAVMGSKNLKAIAVRGSGRYTDLVHAPKPFADLGRALAKRVKEHPQSWDLQNKGTPGLVDGLNAAGILPTRNFHQGAFDDVDKVRWAAYEKELLTARRSCYACAVRCKREVRLNDQVSEYGGPEYETLDSLGPNCGIGDLLAEGTRRAAEVIGGDARYFAMQVKGQELPMHDPRGKVGVGLGYAISEIGADHLTSVHDPMIANPESAGFKGAAALGIEAIPPRELSDRKARNYYILENWNSAEKVLGLCFFGPTPRSFIQVDEVVSMVRAATGWDVTAQDILRIGERATNLARAFNVREGFTRTDDTLPERLFQPLENGALAGVAIPKAEFEQTLTALYRLKGWNPETGAPTREQLRELGVEWAVE